MLDEAPVTLRMLMEKHPEIADLPIVVYCEDGHYDWVGAAGAVYVGDDPEDGEKVLVFSSN
jgi:hypothetical protein